LPAPVASAPQALRNHSTTWQLPLHWLNAWFSAPARDLKS